MDLKKVLKIMKEDYGWSGKLLKEQEDFAQDLVDATEKALSINGVSQQRELLEWLSNDDYFNIPKDEISEILEDWKTYNSNCG